MPLDWSLSAVTHRGSHGLLSCMAYHSSSPLSARRRERQQTGHVSEAAECFFLSLPFCSGAPHGFVKEIVMQLGRPWRWHSDDYEGSKVRTAK